MELTNLFAAKIRAHDILGRHVLKQEKDKEGDQGLDEARRLSNLQKAEIEFAFEERQCYTAVV